MSNKFNIRILCNIHNEYDYYFILELFKAVSCGFLLQNIGQSARISNHNKSMTKNGLEPKLRAVNNLYSVYTLPESRFLNCAGVQLYTFLHWVMNAFTLAKPFSIAAVETVEL